MINKIIPTVCVALILVLSLGQPGSAQNSATEQELSFDLAMLVRDKLELIERETAATSDEWAGTYRSWDGETTSTTFAWSPVSGFAISWYNCSRPTSARANHGTAVFENGLLKITPQMSASVPGFFPVASEFVPVKWGARHLLIPHDQLMKFVYAVNSGFDAELQTFLLKADDATKRRKGRPGVPAEYARYLGMKPILATVSSVKPETKEWYPNITLNVGKSDGVIPSMQLFRYPRRGYFFLLEVVKVNENTSEAAVVFIGGAGENENIQVKRGWKFSSRAPKGSSRFLL